MIKIVVLLSSYLLFTTNFLWAQCNIPSSPAMYYDDATPLFCNGVDGFCSTLPFQYMEDFFPGCSEDFILENPHVISFIAADEFILIRIVSSNCSMPFQESAVQGAIYEEFHPYDGGEPVVSGCEGEINNILDLEYFDYKYGKKYFLVIDGFSANICDYEISVLEGATIAPTIEEPPVVLGPEEICTGQEITMLAESEYTCQFVWDIFGGVIVSQNEGEIIVDVTDANSFTFCVSTDSECNPNLEVCGEFPVAEISQTDSLRIDTICNGDQIFFGGQLINVSGIYETIDTVNCEAYNISLTLEVLESAEETFVEMICDGSCIEINGIEYCDEGNYEFQYPLANGCDSNVVLEIIVIQILEVNIEDEICGEFIWNGEVYDAPGQYQQSFISYLGCDSTVTLYLEEATIEYNLDVTICSNEIFIIDTFAFSDPIVIDFVYESYLGCDSIVHLDLDVEQVYSESIQHTICDGDTLELFGNVYFEMGNYQVINETSGVCDSVVFLQIEVLDTSLTTIDTAFTSGQEYNGIPVFWDTMITVVYNAYNGCDSTELINISVVTSSLDVDYSSVHIYPNPFNDLINIEWGNDALHLEHLLIFDLQGRLVLDYTIDSNDGFVHVNLNHLADGTYIIALQNEKQRIHRKLLKY